MKTNMRNKTMIIVLCALFAALDIIVARFFTFTIYTPVMMKYDAQILIAGLAGYFLGPLWGSLTLVASDLLGALMNSGTIGIFPGFTLTAFLRGFLFGLVFYRGLFKSWKGVVQTFVSFTILYFVLDIVLNAFWISVTTGAPYLPMLATRIPFKILVGPACASLFFAVVKPLDVFGIRPVRLQKSNT